MVDAGWRAALALTLATLDISASPQAPPDSCATREACRAVSLAAAERQDYEAFHDLAWRTLQKSPRNDTEVMVMLARAQSLSGRPADAVVMLGRLADLGVKTDADTSEDFRRVRTLPGWADLERRLATAATLPVPPPAAPKDPAVPAAAPPTIDPAAPSRAIVAPAAPRRSSSRAARTPALVPSAPALPRAVAGETPVVGDASDALRFTTRAFVPAGLAYDAVSDRFIVGDRDARKLTVVDEASHRVANLVGTQSAGFGTIGALEIDVREGDLWVVSSPLDAAASAPGTGPATLHRLQLISGRVLASLSLDEAFGAARFADVAVQPHGGVVVLDAAGQRLFAASASAGRMELAMPLVSEGLRSVAPAPEAVVYVAHAEGISRVDLGARRVRELTAPSDVRLAGFTRLRWHRRGLVGIQASDDHTFRLVRLTLDGAGSRVRAVAVLDRALVMPDPTAAALSGDTLYYLASPAATSAPGAETDTIVRRVTVK